MNLENSTINILLTSLIALHAWNIGQVFALKIQIAELAARLKSMPCKNCDDLR